MPDTHNDFQDKAEGTVTPVWVVAGLAGVGGVLFVDLQGYADQ